MSDLATDEGRTPRQQPPSPAKPQPPTETRLNANAKSFTPSACGGAPLPQSAAAAATPAQPSAKEPQATRRAGDKTPPAGSGAKGPQTSGAQKLAPPPTQLPPAPSGGKKSATMMPAPPPPPPRFQEMGGMVPGMPPPMPGATPTGYMMPSSFMPPPPPMMMSPPNGVVFQPPGAPGMPHHHHHHSAGMAAAPPPPPQQQQQQPQPSMMPLWMPPPPTQQQHHHHQHQQPGMMMPMNNMMPIPMHLPMGAASPAISPGQRSSGPQQSLPPPPQQHQQQQHQQQPGMLMPFYSPPQGPMPHMTGMPPPAPGMIMPRAPPAASGAPAGGTMIPPPGAGAAAAAAMMAPHSHPSHNYSYAGNKGTPGTNTGASTSGLNSSHTMNSNCQSHMSTGMSPAAGRPALMSIPHQPSPPMMMMGHSGGPMMSSGGAAMPPPGMATLPPPPPPPPPLPPSASANARVSVGNAMLAALNSKEPPKFSCVLLSGIPAVGKTTLGRELVNSLKTDGMGWAFFSGADFLAEQQGKRSIWETKKDVFDALSSRLDELLEKQQKDRSIKGLVIDKNCKGIEDVYYLNALLLSKNIPFVGIVGLECADDDVLVQRMGGDDYLKEKLKFHRVIHARIVSLAKSAGMYRYVDATKRKEEVVQMLRTMVLGCCAQPPTRSIDNQQYDDSRANVMVDDYKEYSEVLTHLCRCVNNRGSQFPGSTDLVPFSEREMKDKGRINSIKNRYGVRRKVDGHRYLLIYRERKLYLVPPHMRAVLQMPSKAWIGSRLDSEHVSTVVLEGDLTRLNRDSQKELFLAYDAHYWSEADQPSSNKMIRMTFSERQAFLAANLCNESSACLAQDGVECVVVHQPTQKLSEAVDMLDSEEYPSDGLVFQPVNPIHRSDHVFVWQQPSCVTADFRVGKLLATRPPSETESDGMVASLKGATSEFRRNASGAASPPPQQQQHQSLPLATRRGNADAFAEHPARTFTLEVYDKTEKMYVQYENATVEVRHPDVVEGCIVACSLVDDVPRRWVFRRVRYDVLRPIYKLDLEELLRSCLIPRSKLVAWMLNEQIVPSEMQPEGNRRGAAGGAGGSGSAASVPSVPPPSYDAAAAAAVAAAVAAAGTKGSAAPMGMMQGLALPPPTQGVMPPPMNAIGGGSVFNPTAPGTAVPIAPTTPARSIYPSASAMLSRVTAAPQAPLAAPRPPAQVSTEAQLKQLASIVPSFHVVDGSKEISPGVAATVSATSTAVGSNGTVAAAEGKSAAGDTVTDGSRSCAQCRRPKQSEDLRIDRRDNRPYCYSCWAKSGYCFCSVCGEFKEVRRESKGRHKGSTVCAQCGRAAAAAATAAEGGAPRAVASSSSSTPAAGAAALTTAQAKAEAASPSKARKRAAAKEKKPAAAAAAVTEAAPSSGSASPAAADAKLAGGEGHAAAVSPTSGEGGDKAHAGKAKEGKKKGASALAKATLSTSLPDGVTGAALRQTPKVEEQTTGGLMQVDAGLAPAAAPEPTPVPAAVHADPRAGEPSEGRLTDPIAPATPPAVQDPSKAQVQEEKRSGGGCRQQ
ncbi:hypothetical protein LSCM1_08186 [Leishmania martiniquensis]|uniref:Uncharacterized protein n=1 Tax=Leishmania martiniquensis TaxID=1580590 RepID=A0A836KYZ7_9TRYP|nr:hypothetical protein LSCM1_08186 [Leishmania martiniquensis]